MRLLRRPPLGCSGRPSSVMTTVLTSAKASCSGKKVLYNMVSIAIARGIASCSAETRYYVEHGK